MGAGALGLDLREEPMRQWVRETAQAAGAAGEAVDAPQGAPVETLQAQREARGRQEASEAQQPEARAAEQPGANAGEA